DGNYGANRTVDLVIVKIIETPRECIFRGFPKQAANHCTRDSIAKRHMRIRHESVEDDEQCEGDQQADEREYDLPKNTADSRKQRIVFQLPRRDTTGDFL